MRYNKYCITFDAALPLIIKRTIVFIIVMLMIKHVDRTNDRFGVITFYFTEIQSNICTCPCTPFWYNAFHFSVHCQCTDCYTRECRPRVLLFVNFLTYHDYAFTIFLNSRRRHDVFIREQEGTIGQTIIGIWKCNASCAKRSCTDRAESR